MRLQGRRALVTGGASGIGYAIVQRFLEEGAAVAFMDINPGGAGSAEQDFAKLGRAKGFVADVSRSADCKRVASDVVQFLGGLDILVNNAGIDIKGTVIDIAEDDWDRQLDVNVGGVYRMSKYAVPAIIEAGRGAVVNIGSIAAFIGYTGLAAYCTSKAAVVQLTRCMAGDLAKHNIRVNSVNPGVVDTPLLEHACKAQAGPGGDWQALKHAYINAQMLRRVAQPREIANAVLFLASDEASFITGESLMVDGGLLIQE